MSQHFGDLEGVETDIDDIIVHAETEVKQDHRVHAVLERCEKINLTLNKEKCVFKVKEVTYIGHKLTQEGIKPDDEKVRSINDMPAPTDKKGVERLLGTVNYLGEFISNLATVTEPIRVLLRKDIEFQWARKQYIYGKKVTIESEHKPLEAIVKKALASALPRLQRILLRMQKYDITLEYKPGKE